MCLICLKLFNRTDQEMFVVNHTLFFFFFFKGTTGQSMQAVYPKILEQCQLETLPKLENVVLIYLEDRSRGCHLQEPYMLISKFLL